MIYVLCGALMAAGFAVAAVGWAPRRPRRPRRRHVPAPRPAAPRGPLVLRGVQIGGSIAVAVAMYTLSGLPGLVVLFGGLAALLPPFLTAPARRRLSARRAEAWRMWTGQLAELCRAGTNLSRGLVASAEHAPAEIAETIRRTAARVEVDGLDAALDELAEADELWSPQIAASVRIAHQAGASAATPLLDLARRMGDVVGIHRTQTEAVVKIWVQTIVLLLLSGIIVGLMWFNNPTYFDPYRAGSGPTFLLVIATMLLGAVGYLVRHSVVRGEESVLLPPDEREAREGEPL